MKQKNKQREIFKEKFKELCKEHKIKPVDVLVKLQLPRNYVTLLGVVRIANYFAVSISDLLEKQERNST